MELTDTADAPAAAEDTTPRRPVLPMRPMSPFSRSMASLRAVPGAAPARSAARTAAAPEAEPSPDQIEGRISRIICKRIPDSGFIVLALSMPGGKETTVQANTSQELRELDELVALGTWSTYKGRRQFKAETLRLRMPRNARGVASWLKSAVKGIGPATIARLVESYGDALPDMMRNPEALRLGGLRQPGLAEEASRRWCANGGLGELEATLRKLGIRSSKQVVRIIERFGASAENVVATNPWELTEVEGIGFPTADAIARENGLSLEAPRRLQTGLSWVLSECLNRGGHCGMPENQLVSAASEMLEVAVEVVEAAMERFIDDVNVVLDDETKLVFPGELIDAERNAARHLAALLARSGGARSPAAAEAAVLRAERELGVSLDRDGGQFEAAVMALSQAVCVITGGPGTGKSTTQAVIVKAHSYFGRDAGRISMAAPTGRAAKRLTETSGQEARTIHRLLAFSAAAGGFTYDEDNQLQTDVCIVDEFSMVDIRLFASLAEALPLDCVFTLVGDADQLPSVGPGQVLRDLIASGVVPTARLTRVHRQAAGSGIAVAAQRINAGNAPEEPGTRMRGFSVSHKPDGALLAEIVRQVRFVLPEQGFDPMRDVQVMAAMRKGDVGVDVLNQALKDALNPALDDGRTVRFFERTIMVDGRPERVAKRTFTVDDRVMQFRNDYSKGVYNGETGTITAVGTENDGNISRPWVTVDFTGTEARYTPDDAEDLDLAYAATVHKIQGCEAPVVIFATPDSHRSMLDRNLLYTGVTRARIECRIIGDRHVVNAAPRRTGAGRRHTGLRERLVAAMRAEGVFPVADAA